jgi:hypothetical protein
MTYLQPITFYAILRELPGGEMEIAEHPDGAMKAYAEKHQAATALRLMKGDGWRVDEILIVPPPRTAAYIHSEIRREVDEAIGTRRR